MGRLWPSGREARHNLREAWLSLRQPRTFAAVVALAVMGLIVILIAPEPWSSLAAPSKAFR